MEKLKIILFLPEASRKTIHCQVFGEIDHGEEHVYVYYGFDFEEESRNNPGTHGILRFTALDKTLKHATTSLTIAKNDQNQFKVVKATLNNQNITDSIKDVVIFFYDEVSFTRKTYKKEDSYFTKLQEKLMKQQADNRASKFWTHENEATKTAEHQFNKWSFILKYSSIAMHIRTTNERLSWVIKNRKEESIKITNYLLCVFLDIIVGILSLQFVMSFISTELFPHFFLLAAENCVNSLRESLVWLMGSPAGFKLNKEFNAMLTKFYLFHTDIWWLFLVYISPILGVAFKIFTFLGWLGLTFQAAILSDILGLVSFHAYCIYAYAARLYNIQLSGLRSLWRLFFGRKWNPLREKVDSCQFSADQLFVGTLVFTILLFLLPTTLIYYVFFTWVRLFLVAVGGILSRVRLYLHALPLYSFLLWCFGSSLISTQVHMEVEESMSSDSVAVFNVRRVRGPLLPTLRNGIADCVDTLPALLPKGFFRAILTGELIYPV